MRRAGLSLVELLVATTIAGVALAGAWAWLWSAATPARSLQLTSQAATSAAFALREVAADLEQASAVRVPLACPPERGLLLDHLRPQTAPETVSVVWDPARQVLWRKTSSTYLADHVTSFQVTCLSAIGEPLVPGAAGTILSGVRSVRLDLTVTLDEQSVTQSVTVPVRTP